MTDKNLLDDVRILQKQQTALLNKAAKNAVMLKDEVFECRLSKAIEEGNRALNEPQPPCWQEGYPAGSSVVLFESGEYMGVGYRSGHVMMNLDGNEVCSIEDLDRWVLMASVLLLIKE